jgi:hypothetical protein
MLDNNLDTPRHNDDGVEAPKYRNPISYQDERSREAGRGRFTDEENALNHPDLAIDRDKFWVYSPFVKAGLEILLQAEKEQDDDNALNAHAVNLVVLTNSLKRV